MLTARTSIPIFDPRDVGGAAQALQAAERRTELEAELATPPYPSELAYLLTVFYRLRRRKGGNGFGLVPVEWPDIDAVLRHAGQRFAPWEIEIVEALDDLYLLRRGDYDPDGTS